MYLPIWLNYLIGYSFSILVGDYFIRLFNFAAWTALRETNRKESKQDFRWTTSLLGIIERLLYTSVVLLNVPEFVAVWIAIKAASQWKRWESQDARARATFNLFLTGMALSIAYGVLGGEIVIWLNEKHYVAPIASAISLIIVNLLFLVVVKRNLPKKER